MRPRRFLPAVLALGLAFALTGCGGDDDASVPATTGPGSPTTVPDAVGDDIEDAVEDFAEAGLRVTINYIPSNEPQGTVAAQVPQPNAELQRGDTVELSVSTGGSSAGGLRLPNVTGQPESDATDALERGGFEVMTIDVAAVEGDEVIFQSPTAGSLAPREALVVLYVASG